MAQISLFMDLEEASTGMKTVDVQEDEEVIYCSVSCEFNGLGFFGFLLVVIGIAIYLFRL